MQALRLVEETASTDEFDELFLAHHDFVWRSLCHLGVAAEDAEDATQDVFVVVHRTLETRDDSIPMRAWLFAIARRIAANVRRSGRRRTRLRTSVKCQPSPEPASLDGRIDDEQRVAEALAWLDRLPEVQRMVFVWTEIEGMTAPEIAATLGTSVNTVYSRLRLARRKFERMARRKGDES